MQANQKIKMIGINSLFAHPKNPNRMSKKNLKTLTAHIERTGNYEPVIVRRHPDFENKFQIINGHHRITALRTLGYKKIACVVWVVDDSETLILLQSLNRLTGRDDLDQKARLLKELNKNFDIKSLTAMLGDSKKKIEHLLSSSRPNTYEKQEAKTFLNSIVVFVDDSQKKVIDKAVRKAGEKLDISTVSRGNLTGKALVEIAYKYLNNNDLKEN